MASTLPPVKGAAFSFPIALVSQSDTDAFKETVTLAAGDIQVSKDGGAFANLATFPPSELDLASTADSGVLWVTLTATEMTADVVTVLLRDAAGAEWQSALVTIYTAAQTLDTTDGVADTISGKVIGTLAAGTHTAQTGDAYAVVSNATYGNSALETLVDDLESRIGTPSNLGSGATVAANLVDIEGQTDDIGAAGAGLTALATAAALAVVPAAVDAQLSGTHGSGAWGPSIGITSITYTVTASGSPLAGVYCRMTTDMAGLINVDAGTTNALGEVIFHHNLSSGTTVYIWRNLADYSFSDPDTEVIP